MSDEVKQCPHCERLCMKDTSCNYIFSCGLTDKGFMIGLGCGKSWCWLCLKKFCGEYYNPLTGEKSSTAKDNHDDKCCRLELDFSEDDYCCGGHNSHCNKRW